MIRQLCFSTDTPMMRGRSADFNIRYRAQSWGNGLSGNHGSCSDDFKQRSREEVELPFEASTHKAKKKQHQQHQQQQKPPQSQTVSQREDCEEAVTPAEPYRIGHSEIYGRYLLANRDLAAGELLITELPLAIGPCVSSEPVCLGCYQPVSLKPTQYRCPRCLWPLCGASCCGLERSSGHSKQECELYASRRKEAADQLNEHATPSAVRNLYELVMIVRILLLRESAPEQYAQIVRMESHTEQRRANAVLWQHYEQQVVRRLRDAWRLAERVSEQELHEICGILDVNCFEIGQRGAKARTLYPSAFLLAHDCSPNTAHTDDPLTFAIYLRTSRRVREQEALTLSYAYTLQGTLKRRDFMHDGKLFWCQCQRCADPRELGTDCSALICAACKAGTVRATAPLDQDADWACDCCSQRVGAKELLRLLDRINNDLEAIDAHDIPGLESFLQRYQKVLRPNHYLILSAKYSLCQTYGRTEGYLLPQMSLEDLERKERYCREFLEVIDVLEPNLTRLRGLIMYELHAPIMVLAQHAIQQGRISRPDFQRKLKEVIGLLRESRDILKLEPEGSSEHEMGVAAAEALVKMGCN